MLSYLYQNLYPMCGIVGVFSAKSDSGSYSLELQQALNSILHRGPDYHNHISTPHFSGGHCRLSIIDNSSDSNQPFISEDSNFILLFNGEIFNFTDLKKELEQEGRVFRTKGDTEVVLQGLIAHGSQFLSRLNGFFAISFYDKEKNELLIARDRYGEKPLYYYHDSDFIFASELQALLPFMGKKEIDPVALHYYFLLSYIPAPLSIYKSVFKVDAGCFLKINNAGLNLTRYYSPSNTSFEGTYNDAKNKLHALVEDAVALRMKSDVPLGAFLSGGIDSSIVSSIAAKLDPNLMTFSIGFPDNPFYDESKYADLVAKKIKSKHHAIPITNQELNAAIEPVLNSMAEPFADASAIPVYLLSKKTKAYCTVALSGDGADELFGGYTKYQAFLRSENTSVTSLGAQLIAKFLPQTIGNRSTTFANTLRQLNRYAKGASMPIKKRYLYWASFTHPSVVDTLFLQPLDKNEKRENDNALSFLVKEKDLNSVLKNDLRLVLENDMLVKVDRMSMLNSLEIRPIFLDHRIVEFANSLPIEWKLEKNNGKKILKETFASLLPEEIIDRSKKGFEAPLRQWIMGDLKTRILNDWLSDELILQQGIFNPKKIKAIRQQISYGRFDEHTVWTLIVFQQWWKNNMQ